MDTKPQDATASPVMSPAKLAHVVFRTSNFKPMVNFYKTFLGAHAAYENESLSFLTYDDEHHRIAIAQVPGTTPKGPATAGMDHVSFTFNTLNDLLLAYKQRKAHGILPFWSVNHGPTVSMYYLDPDGNKVETQVDVFETAEDSKAFLSSPAFAENPFGVEFKPEDWITRLENGEHERVLMKRGNVGPRGPESIPMPSVPAIEG
ncbi:hypothetical protein JX265_001445 [Neoarthrinium moseri]|uniref:VOC domain-containing protein n=1 Tax=Neoarthrinium moseri TaxID=1658444 RepID=A0A9Q0AQQ0_9PEZI|nr:hypothetical protein JX266_011602 [Neoarthrinium moseri]KAI1879824.1 hypothetical protein JX265_001445 [Neoarthrinium moseri]